MKFVFLQTGTKETEFLQFEIMIMLLHGMQEGQDSKIRFLKKLALIEQGDRLLK